MPKYGIYHISDKVELHSLIKGKKLVLNILEMALLETDPPSVEWND